MRHPEDYARAPARGRAYRREAEALAPQGAEHVPEPDAWFKRNKDGRPIRAGKRPLLTIGKGTAWAPGLTERQKRRGKVRTARAWGRMIDMLEKTGMTMEEFVATLTPEELVRGKLRDKNGEFKGRPPAWVPAEFHRACIRELMARGKQMWQENYLEAITAMTEIATGKVKGVKPADRLKAAQFVVERMEGKTPEILLVAQDEPWQVIIDDIVAQVPDEQIKAAREARAREAGYPVLDAEIVSEDTDTPPPPRPRSPRRRAR